MKYEPTDVQCPDEAAVPIAKIHCGVYDRGRRARRTPHKVRAWRFSLTALDRPKLRAST